MSAKASVIANVGLLVILAGGPQAQAQPDPPKLELGAQFAMQQISPFDSTQLGLGARVTFNATNNIAVEGEVNFFPTDLKSQLPFSSMRTQGLFGVKSGWRSDKVGVFGKFRPGFMRFHRTPRIACIALLVYPPPIECLLSTGKTELAFDVGGVAEFYPSHATVIRMDLGDAMIRYGGPAMIRSRAHDSGFTSHNFQFNFGFGLRF